MGLERMGVVAALTAVGVFGSAGQAAATVVQGLELHEKVDAAAVVVHGVVQGVRSEWSLPGTQIRTLITVEVKTSLKGDVPVGRRLLVERGGGSIDGFTQRAAGLGQYETGDEVVLFLEPLGAHFVTIGIGIGKYDVRPSAGGEKMVHHAPEVYALRYVAGQPLVEPVPPMSPEPMDSFFQRIRAFTARAPGPSTVERRAGHLRRPPLPLPSSP